MPSARIILPSFCYPPQNIIPMSKKQPMKLYTEEQVNTMLNRARLHKQDDTEMFTNEYLLSQETPIELPSDEEIEKHIESDFNNSILVKKNPKETCIAGAKWMKDYVLWKGNQ